MDAEREMEEYSQKHMSKGRRLVGRIFVYAFRVFVFGVIALVLWRVLWSDRVPSEAKRLLVNDATAAAYAEHGDQLSLFTQPCEPLTYREDENGIYGLFWVSQSVFLPEADQVQILTRYNNSTLRQIAEDFKLDEVPAREQNVVDVTLRATLDPTPQDRENGDEYLVRYYPSGEPTACSTTMYNYRKLVFDGIDLSDPHLIDISVDFYYVERVDYDDVPYGTLCIYDATFENEPVQLSRGDRRALESYKK